jgi:branched-chain amino acid transport system substrate-binding protein
MFKRFGVTAAVAAALAVVVSTTAWGSGNAPAREMAAATAKVKCGKQVTIGVAYPATGAVATLGATQWDWARYAANAWNKNKKNKYKVRLVPGDTQLATNSAQNIAVAHSFASNGKILALVGPAGSQENQDAIPIYSKAGLAAVSGSATRIFLTRATPGNPRETPVGYFYRTVPNDGQQGDRVAAYIHVKLKATHVYIIDDEEAYSQGLADQVQADLAKVGVTAGRNHISQQTTDFSSVITGIPQNTQVVYIPFQVASQAQTLYQQLKAAGRTAIVFGSDGTDVPDTFKGAGSYVSGFPVDFTSKTLKAFTSSHGGQQETFGLPSYTAVMVNATAIQMACTAGKGSTTRAAVRKDLPKVLLSSQQSLLGFPVQFLTKNKGTYQGPGDMGGTADFAIYKIATNGNYVRVG